MTLSQDIKDSVTDLVNESRNFYMMNREDIFLFLARVAEASDRLANLSYDIDVEIGEAKKEVIAAHSGEKITAALMECYIKSATACFNAEKEWIKTQLNLLNGIRIAALAAQRSSE